MNSILPIFAAIVVALTMVAGCGKSKGTSGNASAPAAATAAASKLIATPDSAAQKLVQQAVANVESHASIAGKIRHEVDLFGHQLIGSGTYQQQGRGADRCLRLELKLKVDDQ